jgi:hypothetical protein
MSNVAVRSAICIYTVMMMCVSKLAWAKIDLISIQRLIFILLLGAEIVKQTRQMLLIRSMETSTLLFCQMPSL